MSSKTPETCKGMRDLTPEVVAKRKYMFQVLEKHFQRAGFVPLETPSMEYLSTLTGKYGDEGDQLIFKVLASGDYLKDFKEKSMKEGATTLAIDALDSKKVLPMISDKALRYDLTIPFARFMAKNHRELPLPFKRYQMQPVWRADRPQKGRYREFYQCDADIIGSKSLFNEMDLLLIFDGVFSDFSLPVTIKVNSRKVLTGLAEAAGCINEFIPMTVALDKLDKIGKEAVLAEMAEKGIPEASITILGRFIDHLTSPVGEKMNFLKDLCAGSEIGKEGIAEVSTLLEFCKNNAFSAEVEFDMTLARGLSYYTGPIFEVKSKVGSYSVTIAAGGRYDNLTGVFGVEGLSGVGISFGVDRIFDVLEEQGLFPEGTLVSTKILFTNFGEEEVYALYPFVRELRAKGIAVEMYPESAKLKKQMQYAHDKKVAFVVVTGKDELNNNSVQYKDMSTGEQFIVAKNVFIESILSRCI